MRPSLPTLGDRQHGPVDEFLILAVRADEQLVAHGHRHFTGPGHVEAIRFA